jgi:CRP/FNR family transcriptional regulator
MNKRELIGKSPIFSALSAQTAGALAGISEPRRVTAGEVLFSEGDDADALFILAEGEVDLVKYASDGREHFVRRVKPGEMFAEAAMFAGEAYPVTAVARKAGGVLTIGKSRFQQFVRKHPEASISMLAAMARLLRHWSELISELSLSSVESRIASWLLKQSKRAGSRCFALGMKKKELAFRLGTVPETLSRNFRKFREAGAISFTGDEVTLQDFNYLENIAFG